MGVTSMSSSSPLLLISQVRGQHLAGGLWATMDFYISELFKTSTYVCLLWRPSVVCTACVFIWLLSWVNKSCSSPQNITVAFFLSIPTGPCSSPSHLPYFSLGPSLSVVRFLYKTQNPSDVLSCLKSCSVFCLFLFIFFLQPLQPIGLCSSGHLFH